MARLKKVAPDEAVEAAMVSFWKRGYGNLGTRQIEDETGITRFSLQTFYGGKHKLFLTTLDTYLEAFQTHGAPDSQGKGLEEIAQWFENRAKPVEMGNQLCYGCLMLNSMVEFAATDADVNQRRDRFFDILRGAFLRSLAFSKETGEVSSDFDVDAMAEVLMSTAIGLNIVIRASCDTAQGIAIAGAVAHMVRGWRSLVANKLK